MRSRSILVVLGTIILVEQSGCTTTRPDATYIDKSVDLVQIGKLAILPVVCKEENAMTFRRSWDVIERVVAIELAKKHYNIKISEQLGIDPASIDIVAMHDIKRVDSGADSRPATNPKMPDWVGLLGTDEDRFVLLISVDSFEKRYPRKGYNHAVATLTGFLIDKEARRLVWQGIGSSERHIGPFWVFLFEDLALKIAAQNMIWGFPAQ